MHNFGLRNRYFAPAITAGQRGDNDVVFA